MNKNLAQKILQANITYHSQLGQKYQDQPHMGKANRSRVKKIIRHLAQKTGGGQLLDVGCGTGFIIELAQRYFRAIEGVDITPAMLKQVKKSPKVNPTLANSAKLPYKNNQFDLCTSYSFLHHLYQLQPTIKEIFRVLKKGGYYYNDLDPNYYFFSQLKNLFPKSPLSGIVKKELQANHKLYHFYQKNYQLNQKTIDLAEYHRFVKGGLKEEALVKILKATGFRQIKIFYHWYLGQKEISQKSLRQAQEYDRFLQNLLPFSRNLYKYFGFFAQK